MEGYCAVACLGLADGRDACDITGAWLVWYDPAGNKATATRPGRTTRPTQPGSLIGSGPSCKRPRPRTGRGARTGSPTGRSRCSTWRSFPSARASCPSIPPAPEAGALQPPMTDAELAARIQEIVAAAAARKATGEPQPAPPPPRPPPEPEPGPDKPDLSRPGALTEALRAMGLM
jgi:hypothetical protein